MFEFIFITALGMNMPEPPVPVFNPVSVREVFVEEPPKLYIAPKFTYCSCVEYAKWRLGKQGTKWGNASQIAPTSGLKPQVGMLVLFDNHIAVIADLSTTALFLDEANQIPCQRSQRWINLDDPSIKGYTRR